MFFLIIVSFIISYILNEWKNPIIIGTNQVGNLISLYYNGYDILGSVY
jgi:hypothetical protein